MPLLLASLSLKGKLLHFIFVFLIEYYQTALSLHILNRKSSQFVPSTKFAVHLRSLILSTTFFFLVDNLIIGGMDLDELHTFSLKKKKKNPILKSS